MKEIKPNKSPSPLISFPGIMSAIRAYVYAVVSGENGLSVNEEEV